MNTQLFREITRTVTVAYPVPFLVCAFLAFALCCFALAGSSASFLVPVMAVVAVLSVLAAILLTGYSLLNRPDLLRSERFNVVSRYIDVIGDDEIDPTARASLDRTMLAFLNEDVDKRAVPLNPDDRKKG